MTRERKELPRMSMTLKDIQSLLCRWADARSIASISYPCGSASEIAVRIRASKEDAVRRMDAVEDELLAAMKEQDANDRHD